MNLIIRMLKQIAVYWSVASTDQFGGKVYNDPVEIKCRWEDISVEYLDSQGETKLSNAVVYMDRDILVGGVLMLGTLGDITDEENVKENSGAWEIKRFDKLPDRKAKNFLRTAYL